MKRPTYQNFKESGVEWLGRVPEHWDVMRIRHLFEIRKRISGELGHNVLSITQKGVKVKDTVSGEGQLSMDYSKYQFVEEGDFAMNHMDLLTGYVDISKHNGVTSPDYRVFAITDKSRCYDQFFLYLMQMGYNNKIFFAYGQGSSQLGRWRFPTEQFNDFYFPVPTFDEQKAIASFLDEKTALIDDLIAKKERQIELMKLKRAALINRAVTKGINSDASMKDSGIDYLGRVPEHWDFMQLKRAIVFQRGHDLPSDIREEGNIPLVTSSGISATHSTAIAKSPGIVTGRYGTIGQFYVLNEDYWPLNTTLYSINIYNNNYEYLYYLLTMLSPLFIMNSKKSAVPGVDRNDIHLLKIVLPNIEEQNAIVDFLKSSTSSTEKLIDKILLQIEKLRDYRQSLISAAVTGKIAINEIRA